MNLNLLIEKNIQLRHTYLKATAFSIAFGKSRSTRIFLLTVLVTVRDSYSFVWVTLGVFFESITYHWLCISELINWINFQQTFHVVKSERQDERAKILFEEVWRTSWNFSNGDLDQAKYVIFRVILTTERLNLVAIYAQWSPD